MILFLLTTFAANAGDEYKVKNFWEYSEIKVTICSDSKFSKKDVIEAIDFWKKEDHKGHKNISKEIHTVSKNSDSCKKGWKYGHILIAGPNGLDTSQFYGLCKYWHNHDTDELVSAYIRLSEDAGKSTLKHEIGHAIGLEHDFNDPHNVMYYKY